jgi:hypothetical protein
VPIQLAAFNDAMERIKAAGGQVHDSVNMQNMEDVANMGGGANFDFICNQLKVWSIKRARNIS